MCGIAAVLLGDPKATTAAIELHESLFYLQHRGQDAAGISVSYAGRVYQCKANGMAQKVFSHFPDANAMIKNLPGWCGIAHLRYPTAGGSCSSEAQPFYINAPYGVSISVNGNLLNSEHLREFLDTGAHRHINTNSDSELLLNVFANALHQPGRREASTDHIFDALRDVYDKCLGAFACTAMIAGRGILGFRDAHGIRPLCFGSRPSRTLEGARDYFLASESIALRQLGFTEIIDIDPGMAVFIDECGSVHFRQIVDRKSYTPDAFEFVYFSRPDSVIDGISVHQSRQNMGVKLANKLKSMIGEDGIRMIDVVIPVPETSSTAAAALARSLGIEYSSGFVKNRYVYRTFILPGQDARQKSVRRKLSAIESEFKDKNVLIVDDSIVRGTTSREIVQMAREAGALKVFFASCSPAIRNAHVYGINLANPAELVAYNRSVDEIAKYINADAVVFQDLSDMAAACMEAVTGETKVQGFEVGVFSGSYVTDVPRNYFENVRSLQEERKKEKLRTQKDKPIDLIANKRISTNAAYRTTNGIRQPDYYEDIGIHNIAVVAAV